MYYEEKLIDGVWQWRGSPDGEWLPMGAAMLTRMLAEAHERERGHVALLGDVEWVLDKEYLYRYCPECEQAQSDGHAAGCRIAAALAAAQQEGE